MKISAIVTCYESAATIGITLASLRGQCHQPDEIIVTDDGSSKPTCTYVENLLTAISKHTPIETHFITHKRTTPYRLNTIRNTGISESTGDLVFLVDGDIMVPENILEEHHAVHMTLSDTGSKAYVSCVRKNISGDGTITEGRVSEWGHQLDRFLLSKNWYELNLDPEQTLSQASFLRKDWQDIGGFDPDFDGHWGFDEVEFAYRLKTIGTILTSHGIVYHIDQGAGAGNRDYSRNKELYKRKRAEWLEKKAADNPAMQFLK